LRSLESVASMQRTPGWWLWIPVLIERHWELAVHTPPPLEFPWKTGSDASPRSWSED
jgi:hypothetical protein